MPTAPSTDPARTAILDACLFQYENGDDGALRLVNAHGYIDRNHIIAWSKRGGLSKGQREKVAGILSEIAHNAPAGWLLRFDSERRQWCLNIKGYATAETAMDAVALHGGE